MERLKRIRAEAERVTAPSRWRSWEGEHRLAHWPEGHLFLLPFWLVLRVGRGDVGESGWVGDISSLLSQGRLLWSSFLQLPQVILFHPQLLRAPMPIHSPFLQA